MKHSILNKFLLLAGVASALTFAQPASGANIAFVKNLANTDAFDVAFTNVLVSQMGHTVTYVSQGTAAGDPNLSAYDLFIVSQDVGAATLLGGVGINQPKPMLVYEPGIYDEIFGPSAGGNSVSSLTILLPGNELAAGLSGAVTIYNGVGNIPTFNPANVSAGSQVIAANTVNAAQGGFVLLEAGAIGGGGAIFSHKRIGLPCYDDWNPANVTAEGWKLITNAVTYALKPPEVPDYDHFEVTTTAASPQTAGVAFDVTITGKDISNNTVTTGNDTVNVGAPGSLMEFDWDSNGTYGDASGTLVAGVKTIKARNKKAETATIVASAGVPTTTTPPSVTTTADVFSKLQVVAPGQTAAPGTATGAAGAPIIQSVGSAFSVTVNAVDAYWNPVTATDTVAITSTDNTATLPADAALAAGTQSFSITFNQRGVFTVTATNVSNGLITNGVSALIVSSLPLVWQGDGSANLWDTSALNWTNLAGTAFTFANGDQATFDNTGSSTPAVDIVGTVLPKSVTVNSANNYTLGSTTGGGIGGTASLTKSGTGTLTLSTSNTFSGGSRFSDGMVILSNANALPTSGTLAMTNSMLVLAANNLTRGSITVGGPIAGFAAVGANRSVNVGNVTWGNANFFSGSVTDVLVLGRATDSFTLDFQSQIDFGTGGNRIIQVDDGAAAVDVVISGRIQDNSATPGNLIKTGAGTLQLSHATSNYEGTTEIQNGTVILTGGFNSGNAFILGNGTASGVLQLGNASTNKNLVVGDITTSGTGTGNRVVGGNANVSVLTVNNVADSFSGVFGGPGLNQNNLALTKGLATTFTLTGINTYSGATIINDGTLALNGSGSIGNSVSIDVRGPSNFEVSTVTGGYVLGAAQTLQGAGTVNGNVTANGRIAPGGSGIGTLIFNNNLTLNGPNITAEMQINNTNTPNCDTLAVFGACTPGGILAVTNLGGALNPGDTFQLFTLPVGGSFSSIVYPPGYVFTNKLALDGTIGVLSVIPPAPSPTNITISTSGGNLILNWPAGQGWQLQSQTNSITVGLSANWVPVPGAVPPFTNAVNPANGAVFYRLVYP